MHPLRLPALILRGLLLCLSLAAPAAAESIRNDTGVPVRLQDAPGPGRLTAGLLQPGEIAELGPCDALGQWCLLSTDRLVGWIEADLLPLGTVGPAPVDPGAALPAEVDVTPLPGRPLPSAVLDVIPTLSDPVSDPVTDPAPAPDPSGPEVVAEWDVPDTIEPFLLSMSEPTWNVTTGEINLRAGPGTDAPIVRRLGAGEGGLIDRCIPSEAWCRILPLDSGQPGWVKMTLMGERRLTDIPPAPPPAR